MRVLVKHSASTTQDNEACTLCLRSYSQVSSSGITSAQVDGMGKDDFVLVVQYVLVKFGSSSS